jgi:predicted HAD superfamily Cof-like phosphohydrolase
MSKTNFQMVTEFNNAFGLTVHDKPQPDITKTNPSLTKLRLSLVEEETKELREAIEKHDFVEIVDALADILYVAYGAGSAFGIDLDKAFDIVHKSNMTKLCQTEQDAIDTVEWYKANEKKYDSPAYRKSNCDKYWVVFNQSTGKVLKSIKYTPANLTKLDELALVP